MNVDIQTIITGLSVSGMCFSIFANFKGAKRDIEKEAVEFDRLKTGIDGIRSDIKDIREEMKAKNAHDSETREDIVRIKSEIKTLWNRVERLEKGA